jgi:hypothetical protein
MDEMAATFGDVPASIEGRALVLQSSDSQSWAIAQWAVANAKSQNIVEVDVDGRRWVRESQQGWQESASPSGQVPITVADGNSQ